MFKLTRDEQKVIAFVVFVFVLGLVVRYWYQSSKTPRTLADEPAKEKLTQTPKK